MSDSEEIRKLAEPVSSEILNGLQIAAMLTPCVEQSLYLYATSYSSYSHGPKGTFYWIAT